MAATAGAANDNANALNTDAGTTSAAYLSYSRIASLANLLLNTLLNGQSAKQATIQGGSFYEIAAQYYGDITQAFSIMYANGAFTPWIPNALVANVNLPPAATLMPSYGVAAAQVTPPSAAVQVTGGTAAIVAA